MPTFKASPQQQGYFNWIDNCTGSAVLEAVAGAGKTTTLIEGLRRMQGSIFFGAYNKKIAVEIESKAPKMAGLHVATMHSAGFKAWMRVARGVKVDENKCRTIFRAASDVYPEYKPFESCVLKMVSLAKQSAFGVTGIAWRDMWLGLIDHFDIEMPEGATVPDPTKLAISLAKKTLAKSVEADYATIDFDDMIYAPLIHKTRIPQYDWVLIDEAQDTNASRRMLSLAMLRQGGRLVAVGDRHQAIYGFQGADSDALDLIADEVNAVHLPLTVTYRCPKSVVKHAHTWVKHIEAHPSAPEGKVSTLATSLLVKTAVPGDVILCRFNKPLLTNAYAFISAGIPAKVEGRDIGNGLKELARKWKVKSFAALEQRLETYLERETTKFRAKEQESKAVAVEDKVGCLRLIMARVPEPTINAIETLCNEIDTLFGDVTSGQQKEVVLFSSIHKSKGREWKRVFWLTTGLSTLARKEWELQQEKNLCYVATTRAQEELFLCPLEREAKPETEALIKEKI